MLAPRLFLEVEAGQRRDKQALEINSHIKKEENCSSQARPLTFSGKCQPAYYRASSPASHLSFFCSHFVKFLHYPATAEQAAIMSWPLSPSTSTSSPLTSLPSSPSSRIFHIYNSFPVHYKISDPQKRPLYHVDNSYFTPGTPDLSLYRGEDKKGHLAAVCKFVLFSTCSKIGLMPKPQKSYRDRLNNDIFEIGHKRTHSMGVESSKPSKLSACNYKLVDEESGKIMAVIANNGLKSMNKKGKIELFDTAEYVFAGEQLDIMILMTGIALLEKERRRRAQRRYDYY
ncbi:hypothetical protein TRV_01539 [Trichophyton verrucosum HKI 0517]|uniref:Tubby C-terminal domain-containing protein n=1 Tax=Trichophyton verrucosum (strain HKI 0517) TaxID=663202 RepID=D4D380_TRIVH|nr:uncharacterized protein TRV_01539 [Trichophyton verrucosum HKI 0517]EFE43679.1 hypothetical protein TRV_01539 [Trichophyton verrucosum HKI 0517]